VIVSRYASAVWVDATAVCSATYGAWQPLEAILTMTATTTGTRVGVIGSDALASTASAYIDNIQMIPIGIANEHGQNYSDAGTDTKAHGNTWQL
jgi:hypothetical protein